MGSAPYEPYSKRGWAGTGFTEEQSSIGNIVSCAGIMGVGYWAASRVPAATEPAAQLAAAE